MKRALPFAIILLAASAPRLVAQTLPSTNDMVKLIQAAHARRPLGAPGSPPFHLIANIRYTLGSDTTTGKYEMLWADPTHFHQEFRVGSIIESDVANGDMRYIFRNTPYERYSVWQIRALIGEPEFTSKPLSSAKVVVRNVRATANLTCAEVHSPNLSHEICFDTGTNQIASEHIKAKSSKASFEVLRDEFAALGDDRYPLHLLYVEGSTVEVNIVALNRVDSFVDGTFAPPPDAVARVWCQDPVVKTGGTDPFLSFVLAGAGSSTRAYYYVIGANGLPEEFAQIYPVERKLSPETVGYFPIKKCMGVPIEYEGTMSFNPLDPP